MDLAIVGRHTLLFDDDAMAAFVNSGAALVDWHSLQIDRYDVRHLLSSPPPPRRRNRNFKPALLDDSSLASQLDHERFRDLHSIPDPPDVEGHEHQMDAHGFHNVAFSYGYADDSVEKKIADAEMESSRFFPPFPIPNDLLQSLPPTEKVHQIIARTALFVSKHGGQSEIILRVKQGDNPTFGFLMPGHHLHPYFRFLVDHPEVHSESDGKFQNEQKKSAVDHNQSNGADGALALLGSVYGSGEELEDDNVKPEKDVSLVSTYSLHHSDSHTLKKTESQADAKDEPVSKKSIFSNREKVLTVKKNSLITGSNSGTAKVKEQNSGFFSDDADKTKSLTSKIGPVALEPPSDVKRLIDESVKLIMTKGEQFETTLIKQDSKHEQFPFLLQSNPYHSYYLKVLQTAKESKLSHKGFVCGTNNSQGCKVDKKASTLKEKDFSSTTTDMSLGSDWKKKFKIAIGKSEKETQEPGSKETRKEFGVDTATAAALLHAATRRINDSNSDKALPSKPNNVVEKSYQNGSCNVSAPAPDTEPHMTKEEKVKAERLKRAKMFVAMLKIGELPSTAGTSRGSSLEPKSADIGGPDTGEQLERNYFGDHNERSSKRKYRMKSGACEDEDRKKDSRNHKSVSHRNYESSGNDTGIEVERKHRRRRHRAHSFSGESDVEGRSSEEDMDRKRHKMKRSSHGHRHVDECEDKYKEDKSHKRSRKSSHRRRHRTRSSSDESDYGERSEEDRDHKKYKVKHHQHVDKREDKYKEDKNHKRDRKKQHDSKSRKRSLSVGYSRDEDENEKQSGKRYHSRDKHSDKEPQCKFKSDATSGDEHQNRSCLDKQNNEERNELEEGEIGLGTSASLRQRAPSEPSQTTTSEVPDDLRAKIRAMLMSTAL